MFLQKLFRMWHCFEKWQKGSHSQPIRTPMPTDDERTKLLPKIHDLRHSHWVYTSLPSRFLKTSVIENERFMNLLIVWIKLSIRLKTIKHKKLFTIYYVKIKIVSILLFADKNIAFVYRGSHVRLYHFVIAWPTLDYNRKFL